MAQKDTRMFGPIAPGPMDHTEERTEPREAKNTSDGGAFTTKGRQEEKNPTRAITMAITGLVLALLALAYSLGWLTP